MREGGREAEFQREKKRKNTICGAHGDLSLLKMDCKIAEKPSRERIVKLDSSF